MPCLHAVRQINPQCGPAWLASIAANFLCGSCSYRRLHASRRQTGHICGMPAFRIRGNVAQPSHHARRHFGLRNPESTNFLASGQHRRRALQTCPAPRFWTQPVRSNDVPRLWHLWHIASTLSPALVLAPVPAPQRWRAPGPFEPQIQPTLRKCRIARCKAARNAPQVDFPRLARLPALPQLSSRL